MLSPEWELEDYGWRPSFSAEEERGFGSGEAGAAEAAAARSLAVALRPPPLPRPPFRNRFLPVIVSLAGAAGDLAAPKRAVAAMADARRMRAWSRAFEAEAAAFAASAAAAGGGGGQEGAFSVVVVGGASGALGILASKASSSLP